MCVHGVCMDVCFFAAAAIVVVVVVTSECVKHTVITGFKCYRRVSLKYLRLASSLACLLAFSLLISLSISQLLAFTQSHTLRGCQTKFVPWET